MTIGRIFDGTAVSLAFPLGGIGTGNVSLGARGEFRDWEIFNRPHKGLRLPNTFFALWAQAPGQPAVTRVLEGTLQPPHDLSHGYHPNTGAGLPRCAEVRFRGEYPLAFIDWREPALPVTVSLEAYTPCVPLNPDDSGLPCARLRYTLANTNGGPVSITLAGSVCNPIGGIAYDSFYNLAAGGLGQNVNTFRREAGWQGLHFTSTQFAPGDLRYGDLALVTTAPEVTVKPQWLRGPWYDDLQEFWDDFSADGRLNDLGYAEPSAPGRTDTGSLGVTATLAPGETRQIDFWLTWHFPNRVDHWDNRPDAPLPDNVAATRNHYAAQFDDAWAVARYAILEAERLDGATRAFQTALFTATLPDPVVDALSANIVPLRSPVCFWLADGRFFGFEGSCDDGGSCEGSCTHVWSYAQTLAYLFPSLEREMRRIEFVHETNAEGWMAFRSHQTFGGRFAWGDKPAEAAVDGQLGSVLRVYREWLVSGDRAWLEQVWPGVQRALAYAAAHWDPDNDGVLEGKQHTTYDIEFYGPNPLGTLYYLAALRASAALAEVMGQSALARQYRHAADQAAPRADAALWNGEYYQQPPEYAQGHKYQHGLGCLSDQLMGQWHAHQLGLGALLPQPHTRAAAQAIYRHNYKPSLAHHINFQRTYALPDEAGLLLCTWPHGGRPAFPFVYSDEVWTGIEYAVAALLIYEGWPAEGLEIVATTRGRQDGVRRNPWDEVECGHHYARSMSSWSVLLALTGFHCDMAAKSLAFEPVLTAATEPDTFRAFWSCGRGWGVYEQARTGSADEWAPHLHVLGGDLSGFTVQAVGKSWTVTDSGLVPR
jgi:non-lysosomal glucosylceramidase